MNRKPPNKIVAKYTAEQLAEQEAHWREHGYQAARFQLNAEAESLKRQKEQLSIDQTRAVTDLIRATTENLSKAGYLIGKLNKDNSR